MQNPIFLICYHLVRTIIISSMLLNYIVNEETNTD